MCNTCYPQEWLEKTFTIWTNEEILNMSIEERQEMNFLSDWFNPFDEPEKLTKERQQIDMKPLHWRKHVAETYPGIDATEQFRIRKREVGDRYKLERVAKCRKHVRVINPESGEAVIKRLPPCRQYDICPDCASYKREMEMKQLTEMMGQTRFLIVPKEDELKIARGIADNYKRYPIGDNQTAFVIETDNDEIGEKMSYEKCELLAQNCISDVGRRVTGTLGKPQETEEIDNSDKVKISRRQMSIDYDSKQQGAPKNFGQLQNEVFQESKIEKSPETKEELQWSIYELEQKYKAICEKYEMSFNFVDIEYILVDMKEVDWQWVKNKVI